MKLRIVALGNRMPAWVTGGMADYTKRFPRDYALDLVELKPEPRGKPVGQLLASEAVRVRAACEGYRMIALDERGSAWSTRDFADRLVRWRDDALDIAFVIGSADGLYEALTRQAHDRLCLSAFTLPHGLVRVILAEQLYRVVSLISGHPYHRD